MPPIEARPEFGSNLRKVAADPAAVIQLAGEDLACHRGGRDVFTGVSFALAGGEALIVKGPNGAGKTSLLRMVAGLLTPAGGRVALAGGDPERTVAEQAHYVGHQDALKPALSVMENLQFWADYLGGGGAPSRAALATLGLEGLADLPAAYLSAGQRRRLSLARLLTAKRLIWLLDEPTAALDTRGEAQLSELMQVHLGGGGIIMAATHGPLGLASARELKLGASA